MASFSDHLQRPITMQNGTVYRQGIGAWYGNLSYPMPEAELVFKCIDCGANAANPVSRERLDNMATRLSALENETHLLRGTKKIIDARCAPYVQPP